MHRVLRERFGVRVFHVMGMTDIDDKIIRRASERNESPTALARSFEHAFLQDMQRLGVRPPAAITRVTDRIAFLFSFLFLLLVLLLLDCFPFLERYSRDYCHDSAVACKWNGVRSGGKCLF